MRIRNWATDVGWRAGIEISLLVFRGGQPERQAIVWTLMSVKPSPIIGLVVITPMDCGFIGVVAVVPSDQSILVFAPVFRVGTNPCNSIDDFVLVGTVSFSTYSNITTSIKTSWVKPDTWINNLCGMIKISKKQGVGGGIISQSRPG